MARRPALSCDRPARPSNSLRYAQGERGKGAAPGWRHVFRNFRFFAPTRCHARHAIELHCDLAPSYPLHLPVVRTERAAVVPRGRQPAAASTQLRRNVTTSTSRCDGAAGSCASTGVTPWKTRRSSTSAASSACFDASQILHSAGCIRRCPVSKGFHNREKTRS
jgi:hypothetical protein